MTRESAIAILDRYAHHSDSEVIKYPREVAIEAFEMAIEALKAEPCEDAVSREAVLNGLASIAKAKAKSDAQKALMGRVMFFTEQLPPVTPKPRTGKWIVHEYNMVEYLECDQCRVVFLHEHLVRNSYCPNCGAKMEGESEC